MSNFDIFVDSAANLPDDIIAATGIKVIPFISTVNGEELICYKNGKSFSQTAKEFYEKMAEGAEAKTSLISEERFIDEVTPSLEEGKDAIIITLASTLSGTFNQAHNAQIELEKRFDSQNASLGEGLLAVEISKMRGEGKTITECSQWFAENVYRMNSYVTVNDMKYLKRSGRVSTVIAIAGAILNIKPMLRADGVTPASLSVYAKERGRRKSIVAIAHCNCVDEANDLAEKVKALGAKDVIIEYYDLCTGSHVGPGTLALFFMGKDRRETEKKK